MRTDIRLKVSLAEGVIEVFEGATIAEVFGETAIRQQRIVAATLNQGLVGLHTEIQGECSLLAVTANEPIGKTVCRRSIAHMLQTLACNRGDGTRLVVGQSMAGGCYYEVENLPSGLTLQQLAAELNDGFHHLAQAELRFTFTYVSIDGARRQLTDPSGAKAALLEIWPTPMLTLVRLGEFVDIPHGPYAPHTGVGAAAKVIAYESGILLDFNDNGSMPSLAHSGRLWSCYRETVLWNRRLNIETIGFLNRAVLQDREVEVIRISEALHEKRIANIADNISETEMPIVCVAGPSSSGKTTFMARLSDQLRVNGVKVHLLSLDDYYRSREEYPRDEQGRYDFESPHALNLPLLHEHFAELLAGREITLPYFDFTQGLSLPSKKKIRLEAREVVIVEGIHGNNPTLTGPLPESKRYRIFVNALNQLRIDDHNRVLTSDTRLLRRLVRDRLYRGTSANDTILQWNSVLAGERKYIYPYQDHTDMMFNSALVYETAVLKPFAQRFLLEVPRDSPARVHAYRLLRFLELFVPVFPGTIPINSILREFIGPKA